MTRVLVVTSDPIGPKMAGPAIRSWNIALILSAENEVRLVTTSKLDAQSAPFEQYLVPPGRHRAFRQPRDVGRRHRLPGARDVDVPVAARTRRSCSSPTSTTRCTSSSSSRRATCRSPSTSGPSPTAPSCSTSSCCAPTSSWRRPTASACSTSGQLAALGRLNPLTYGDEPDLKRLLRIVPFGLPSEPPVHQREVMKGVVPGIGRDDKVVIWGGGLYSWFDPLTLIRAIGVLYARRPSVRLFFQGTKHPGVAEMPIVQESRELARELGLLDTAVFFNETWVPYEERQNFLLEADAGVSTHGFHLETTLAFRTRILDYLWAALPMVVTKGDSFGELVKREELGVAVPPGGHRRARRRARAHPVRRGVRRAGAREHPAGAGAVPLGERPRAAERLRPRPVAGPGPRAHRAHQRGATPAGQALRPRPRLPSRRALPARGRDGGRQAEDRRPAARPRAPGPARRRQRESRRRTPVPSRPASPDRRRHAPTTLFG